MGFSRWAWASQWRELFVGHQAQFAILENAGVKLQLYKNTRALFDELYAHVLDETRTAWHTEMEQVGASLNEQKEQLGEQIRALITPSHLDRSIWRRIKEIKNFAVTKFQFVHTELPEREHRPPHSKSYSRPNGGTVAISASASSQIEAVVETPSFFSWNILIGRRPPTDEPEPPPTTETIQLHEDLNVSLIGKVRDGIIGDIQVTAIEPERP